MNTRITESEDFTTMIILFNFIKEYRASILFEFRLLDFYSLLFDFIPLAHDSYFDTPNSHD